MLLLFSDKCDTEVAHTLGVSMASSPHSTNSGPNEGNIYNLPGSGSSGAFYPASGVIEKWIKVWHLFYGDIITKIAFSVAV